MVWSHLFRQYKLVPLSSLTVQAGSGGRDVMIQDFSTIVLFPGDSAEKDRKPATIAPVKRQQLAVLTSGLAPLGSL